MTKSSRLVYLLTKSNSFNPEFSVQNVCNSLIPLFFLYFHLHLVKYFHLAAVFFVMFVEWKHQYQRSIIVIYFPTNPHLGWDRIQQRFNERHHLSIGFWIKW